MSPSRAVMTFWYITTDNPAAVLETEPRADRGFGRKFLAQLNPAFPVTPIGQFPLNRSAQADTGEFYIGGYPGVTVVQTVIEDTDLKLSELSPLLLGALPANDLYVFADNEETGYAGFARWHEGALKRSFCGTRFEIFEDTGLPEPFEGPYWAGEKSPELGGIALPFDPADLTRTAEREWLGISIDENGPDLQVAGYAVDGRPEPKIDEPSPLIPVSELASTSASKLGLGEAHADYDDYEDHDTETNDEFARLAEASADAAKRVGREGKALFAKAKTFVSERYRTFKER